MPTVEQLKLRKQKIEMYVVNIATNGPSNGLAAMEIDIKKRLVGPDIRIDVMALALARRVIGVEHIPPRYAKDVTEKWLKEASNRERDVAADRGTEVHNLAERLSNGEILTVPEELAEYIRSWQQFRNDWQIRIVATEFTVFNPEHNYAGTGDLLFRSDMHPELGLILGDYKTSKSGIWPDIALQLAALKYGKFIGRCLTSPVFHENHDQCLLTEDPVPEIQTCVGIQITDTGYQVVPVHVDIATFHTFLSGITVAKWKTKGEKWALDKDTYPFKETTNARG